MFCQGNSLLLNNLDAHIHQHQSYGYTSRIAVGKTTWRRGLWAIKWSLVGLLVTASIQFFVVKLSGSVALLADAMHNLSDAAVTILLLVAFTVSHRRSRKQFTYGYLRIEDLTGIAVVLAILFSAIATCYESIDCLFHPRLVEHHWAVIAAAAIGFLGNEITARLLFKTGREIGSTTLTASGHHARIDGLTSISVVFGTIGAWLGYPLANPIVGLLVSIVILGIAWQSSKTILGLRCRLTSLSRRKYLAKSSPVRPFQGHATQYHQAKRMDKPTSDMANRPMRTYPQRG